MSRKNLLFRARFLGSLVLASAWLGGCAGTSNTSTTGAMSPDESEHAENPTARPIVAVWKARCSQCHAPVEPRTRDRAQLTAALTRHRNRTHLSDAEWQGLVDYLAPSP